MATDLSRRLFLAGGAAACGCALCGPAAAQGISFDAGQSCGFNMGGALPVSIPGSAMETVSSAANVLGPQLIRGWDEFVNYGKGFMEEGLGLWADLRVTTAMPFEDVSGQAAMNPGCMIPSNSMILLSGAFLDFAFAADYPERAATGFAVLFHEYGHLFATRQVPAAAPFTGRIDTNLRYLNFRANELFSDMFAGMVFFFWNHEVRRRLNLQHPTYGRLIRGMINYDQFRFTFRYMGCHAPASSAHGTYAQRHDAFNAGVGYSDSLFKQDLRTVTAEELDRFVLYALDYLGGIDDSVANQNQGGACVT